MGKANLVTHPRRCPASKLVGFFQKRTRQLLLHCHSEAPPGLQVDRTLPFCGGTTEVPPPLSVQIPLGRWLRGIWGPSASLLLSLQGTPSSPEEVSWQRRGFL